MNINDIITNALTKILNKGLPLHHVFFCGYSLRIQCLASLSRHLWFQ